MESLISVIIPVYNTEQYVGKCLDSIIANDYKNLEIICVNDGSTDGSINVLHEYEQKDNRIIVFDIPHRGVSNARNTGLDNCSGEYIAFIDSDDFIHNQYFGLLLTALVKDNAIMSICDGQIITKESESLCEDYLNNAHNKRRIEELLFSWHRTNCWGKLYAKKYVLNYRFPDELWHAEDKAFNTMVMLNNRASIASVIDKKLYYYYQRQSSVSHNLPEGHFLDIEWWYLNNMDKTQSRYEKEFYVAHAIESGLAFRYYNREDDKNQLNKKNNTLINSAIRVMKHYGLFSKKKRVAYSLYSAYPLLHRAVMNKKSMGSR